MSGVAKADDEDADEEEAETDEDAKAECETGTEPTDDEDAETPEDTDAAEAPNAHGKAVSEVAKSDAIGGKNCNHGGAVSEAAHAANAEKAAERAAARPSARERAAAKAERAAARGRRQGRTRGGQGDLRAAALPHGTNEGRPRGRPSLMSPRDQPSERPPPWRARRSPGRTVPGPEPRWFG